MRIFAEGELGGHLDGLLHDMQRTVRAETKEQLLNSNEPDYVKYLVSRYRIEPPSLHEQQIHVTAREQMIRADRFPTGFYVRDGAAYSKQVITYHLPFSGEPRILYLAPSSRILWTMNVEIHDQEILFEIVNWQDDPEASRGRRKVICAASDNRQPTLYAKLKHIIPASSIVLLNTFGLESRNC